MFSPYCVTKGLDWMSNSCISGAERRSWKPLQGYHFGSSDDFCSSSECWKGPHRDPHPSSPLLLWGSWRSPQPLCYFFSPTIKVIFQPSWLCSCSIWGTTWLISSLFGTHITFLHFISSAPTEVTRLWPFNTSCKIPALSCTFSHCPEPGATLQPRMLFVALWLCVQQDTSRAHSGIRFRIDIWSPTSFPINSGDNIHNNFNGSMIIL